MWPQNDFRTLTPSIEPTGDQLRVTELTLRVGDQSRGEGVQSALHRADGVEVRP